MDNDFDIAITYKSKQLTFPAKLLTFGYIYKIEVLINDTSILYEKDDEGEWRALISFEELQGNNSFDIELLKSIAVAIDELFK